MMREEVPYGTTVISGNKILILKIIRNIWATFQVHLSTKTVNHN